MSGQQNVGDAPSFVFGRAAVDRWSKQVVLERVAESALFVAYSPRDQPDNGIGYGKSRELATGEDIITNGYLTCDQMLADTEVDPFVVAAEDNDIVE